MSGNTKNPKFYIETYGCQMNVLDSEVVVSIMQQQGYQLTENIENADLILINTCSVRDNAEQRVRGRLDVFRLVKQKHSHIKVGVIGCMAERLKEQLIEEEKAVDMVVGPDAYRDLPRLLEIAGTGQKAVNVVLSQQEVYADINPIRLDKNRVSAFVAVMRGCNNYCSYCIVPYVRGKERSRSVNTILDEVKQLQDKGYKEVTLIGQNANSYRWNANGMGTSIDFPALLAKVAALDKNTRIRYSTSHPKDLSDELIYVMRGYDNICKNIHLPLQSGSTRILKLMNRGYTREWYMGRVSAIKEIIPTCSLSTDIITGFCSETESDHKDTLSMMEFAQYDFAYMFKYSERPGTPAARKLEDNITEDVKTRRLQEIIALQNELSLQSKQKDVGNVYEVLVEGVSKKNKDEYFGRNSQNKVIVFPKDSLNIGDYSDIKVHNCTSATLIGKKVVNI